MDTVSTSCWSKVRENLDLLREPLQFAEELLSKPAEERCEEDILRILPWIRHQSSLFKTLDDDVLGHVITHVKFVKVKKDHVISKQGDLGNCFYVILKGAVSEYAKKEEELHQGDYFHHPDTGIFRSCKERIAHFGTELGSLKTGSSFGEMALMSDKKERNATVIADELTELISIDEDLYKKSFYVHKIEWEKRSNFVQACPLFSSWPTAFKDLLIEHLSRRTIHFGNRVVEQQSPCTSVYFIAKGAAKVLCDPRKCKEQYEAMKPRRKMTKARDSVCNEEEEKIALNEIDDLVRPLTIIERRRRRLEHGFVAMETRLRQREIQATTIGPNDVIGDVEMVLELPEYCASVECVETLEVYELDKASFHRLIARRNPETLELLRQVVITKLTLRVERFGEIPFYGLLLERATTIPQKGMMIMKKKRQPLAALERIRPIKPIRTSDLTRRLVPNRNEKKYKLENRAESLEKEKQEKASQKKGGDRKRSERKEAVKKQYTVEEFRELKKKMQARGKLIGRVPN